MKKAFIQGGLLLFAIVLGIYLGRVFFSQTDGNQDAKGKPLYWVAPMDPTFRRDKPGKSPMGMDLVPVYKTSTQKTPADVVEVSPVVEQNLGIRTTKVIRTNLSRQIETVGYVKVDEAKIQHLHPFTDGWVRNLYVKTTDQHVDKGSLLLDLYSPTLNNAQEEYLLALRSNNPSLIAAARNNLAALGVSEQQIADINKNRKATSLVQFYAKQSGVVSTLNVRQGMYVTPQLDMMTIEDLSTIWVIAEVFERQSNWVKAGQKAIAYLPYLPDKQWAGTVEYVYPHLDPETHTLEIRLRFDNPDILLKPNMYANVKILASPENNVLAIPNQAVIREGQGRDTHVILALGQGQFKPQKVVLGIESGDMVEVRAGLKAGDTIVTSGEFLLDSEASIQASFERMDAGDAQPTQATHSHQDRTQ